jgi:hypothetical protein
MVNKCKKNDFLNQISSRVSRLLDLMSPKRKGQTLLSPSVELALIECGWMFVYQTNNMTMALI